MKMWKVAAALLLTAQVAHSADIPANQFYRTGDMVNCGKPLPAGTDPSPPTYTPCLRTGAIGIGDELKSIETHLGQALEPPRNSNGRELRLYSYDPSNTASYIVVGYEGGRATSIQVVGPQPKGKHPFAALEIGDALATVVAKVGNPSYQRCNVTIHQEIWNYEPFPFYLNMSEGALAGFRLVAAPEFEGAFEPLKRLDRLPC